ncbi:MAG TPA: folate-binding protein, partial [Lysobacter sp.]
LEVGGWQWNGWLTPKGRVVALFALARVDESDLWAVLPDFDPDAFATALRRFVFRSKVEIAVPGPIAATARVSAPQRANANRIGEVDGAVELDMGVPGAPRTLVLAPASGAEAPPSPDATAAEAWRALDIECGLPRLAAAQSEQWTPQQLSLERLNAFSVKKGCYPGQEIVARTHFLGKAKRGLALLEGSGVASTASDVCADGAPLGTVVSTAGRIALAVLPLGEESRTLTVDGLPVQERPLRPGLAR